MSRCVQTFDWYCTAHLKIFSTLYNNSEDVKTMKKHIWNHVVTRKVFKQIKIYFTLFKVATLCLDDSFAHSWHSLNQLHEVVTWNAFQLTGVPC